MLGGSFIFRYLATYGEGRGGEAWSGFCSTDGEGSGFGGLCPESCCTCRQRGEVRGPGGMATVLGHLQGWATCWTASWHLEHYAMRDVMGYHSLEWNWPKEAMNIPIWAGIVDGAKLF